MAGRVPFGRTLLVRSMALPHGPLPLGRRPVAGQTKALSSAMSIGFAVSIGTADAVSIGIGTGTTSETLSGYIEELKYL